VGVVCVIGGCGIGPFTSRAVHCCGRVEGPKGVAAVLMRTRYSVTGMVKFNSMTNRVEVGWDAQISHGFAVWSYKVTVPG
jgi:hypothetical protein